MDAGISLTVLDTVDSTNAYAKRLAEAGAPEGTAVLALEQTVGRGRLDRRFVSPRGGVYLSVILRPRAAVCDATAVTLETAVAAAEAIEAAVRESGANISVGIKWVNDLYVGGRKLAGILCEGAVAPSGDRLAYVVVGIGINLLSGRLPHELVGIATTVEDETGVRLAPDALARAVTAGIVARADSIGAGLGEYRRRQILFGRLVTVTRGSERFLARPYAVSERGELAVIREGGGRELLAAGEVTLHGEENDGAR